MVKCRGAKMYIPVAKPKKKNQPNLMLTEYSRDIYLQVPLLLDTDGSV
jgi:hypothetical protein